MTDDEELIEHLQQTAEEFGRAPSSSRFNDIQDEYTSKDYVQNFDSWLLALEAAGLEFIRTRETNSEGKVKQQSDASRVTDEELIRELEEVFGDRDQPAGEPYFEKHSKYNPATVRTHFGSWAAGVREAGVGPTMSEVQWVAGDNPNWRGGVDVEYGEDWKKSRQLVLERDGYECQICGQTQEEHLNEYGRDLDVHHIIPKRRFDTDEQANQAENLITLCRGCHQKWEGVPVLPTDS